MGTWIEKYIEQNPDMARQPVVKQTAHSTHFQIAPGVARAVITSGPQSYRERGGWTGIDATLHMDHAGGFGAPGLAARVNLDGVLTIESAGYRQQTVSIGTLSAGKYGKIGDLPRGQIADGKLVREEGSYRHEVILTERGVKEQLVLLEKPIGLAGDQFVFETIVPGGLLEEGRIEDEVITDRGIRVSPGRAFDGGGQFFPMECWVIDKGAAQYVYSGLPLSALERAVYPLTMDPIVSIGADTSDGDVWGQNTTYATARTTSFSFATSASLLFCGQFYDSATPRYFVQRNFLKFNLGSIDPDANLFSATLGLVCAVDDSVLADFDVQVVKQNWSAQDPLATGNREAAFDNCLAGTIDVVWRNTSGIVTGMMHHSPPLDLTYLAPGSLAYYSLRSSRDKSGTQPPGNGAEWLQLGSGNHSNPAYRPVLTIDYATVVPAAGRFGVPALNVGMRDTRIKLRARERDKLLTTVVRNGGEE